MEYLELIVDYGILGLLALMGFITLWFFIERLFYYRSVDFKSFSSKEDLEIDLTARLSTIATIGSNAPYIGLLGTVLGIMLTFYQLGNGGALNAQNIMLGLALALKATALGLVVAIPSITFYNMLLRKIEVLLNRFEDTRESIA